MSLAEGSRRATSPWELAKLLSRELNRALHLESISIFVLDPTNAELRCRDPDAPCVALAPFGDAHERAEDVLEHLDALTLRAG